jgi:hypothetical protein
MNLPGALMSTMAFAATVYGKSTATTLVSLAALAALVT